MSTDETVAAQPTGQEEAPEPTSLDERRAAEAVGADAPPEAEGMTAPSAIASVPWAAIRQRGWLAGLIIGLLSVGLLVAWRQTRST